MFTTADLNVLFPTSFSDACFRTARAIAQLADTFRVNLTIAHVAMPGSGARAQRELDSFMAEADHYDNTRRVLMQSDDPIRAIASLCEEQLVDLLVAPASDRLGLHSLYTRSFRARLLTQCKTPLWTAGSCLDTAAFKGSIRKVAYLVEAGAESTGYLHLAEAFAKRIGARLHVLHVLPSVHEGMLAEAADGNAPLMPKTAANWIHSLLGDSVRPSIDIAIGSVSEQLPRMLCKCDADLVFLSPQQSLRGIRDRGLARHIDRLPCPAVCLPWNMRFDSWLFDEAPAADEVLSLVRLRDYAIAR